MAVYVDVGRCIGCRSCEVACQRVHGDDSHIKVHYSGHLASYPIVCKHCTEATCAIVCATGALLQEEGRVVFLVERCTGCGLCWISCPYGAIAADKLAHKCDLCSTRDVPACVMTCPAQALSVNGFQPDAAEESKASAVDVRGGV